MKVLTRALPGSPEWLQARKGKITATRGSNVLCSTLSGVSTYKSALEEYKALSDELAAGDTCPVPVDDEESDDAGDDETEQYDPERADRLQWGLDSEPLHITKLQRETGWVISPEHAVMQDEEYPWLAASLDALCHTKERMDPGVAELKAPTGFGAAKWRDGKTPMLYQVQTAIELRVTGLRWGVVSALIPPSIQYDAIEWDEKIHAWLMEGLLDFWQAVQDGRAPRPRATDSDIKILREMAQPKAGKVCYFSPAMTQWRDQREQANEAIKRAKAAIKEANIALIQDIGDAALGVFESGDGYTFRPQTKQMKAQEARVVEVKPFLKYVRSAL